MDPTKLKVVKQWKPPKSVKAVRSFIGFCNFYRKFIPHFSALAQPLINLTKKGVAFHWGKEQDDTFIKLKETFLSVLVIKMLDTTKPFFVMTDASLTASGGILMQRTPMETSILVLITLPPFLWQNETTTSMIGSSLLSSNP